MKKSPVLVALLISNLSLQAATTIPLNLPRPDGQPGNSKKPVKVYILAGQSNMVGMGDITGAQRPRNVFLSADPAIIPGGYRVDRVDEMQALDSLTVSRYGVYEAKTATTPVALGTVAENLPATAGAQPVVVTAQIDVPVTGMYQIHAGFGASTNNVVALDGQPVTGKVKLEAGKRYPIKITYSKSGSAAFWLEQVDLVGKGDLAGVTKNEKKFSYLVDDAGKWTERNDVTYIDPRLFPTRASSPLSATSNNGKSIGPELGFGSVMGTFHDEQVLVIKTAQGNRSLGFDFRPPSSGHTEPASKFEGFEYRAMVEGVRDTLAKIDKVVPGYAGQGYEMAGFFWFQGHKDSGSTKEDYEKNLVNLISDLRKEFNAPKMPAVVATVGFHGYRINAGPWSGVWAAQMAVGDAKQHPEFDGNVASVDTRDFWREVEESPRGQDYHYNRNAETYMLVGEAAGRAMVRLQGGEAAAFPKSDREAQTAARLALPVPTAEQLTAHWVAMRPMLINGALASFLRNTKNLADVQAAVAGKIAAKPVVMIDDALDLVVGYYQAAGVRDYDWKPFGSGTKTATWDYFGIDLPDHKKKTKTNFSANEGENDEADPDAPPAAKGKKAPAPQPPQIVLPTGMENWFAPEFDAKKAGWKSGPAPFGETCPTDLPEWVTTWQKKRNRERPMPATVTDNDVLLLRQTFDLPASKPGSRYRIRMAGSPHNNMGEGYAIYINGKLLLETRDGLTAWHREVYKTRGAFVTAEFRDQFKGGKVTIAVANYPLWGEAAKKMIAPGPALTVCLEEQKLPPLEQ